MYNARLEVRKLLLLYIMYIIKYSVCYCAVAVGLIEGQGGLASFIDLSM